MNPLQWHYIRRRADCPGFHFMGVDSCGLAIFGIEKWLELRVGSGKMLRFETEGFIILLKKLVKPDKIDA